MINFKKIGSFFLFSLLAGFLWWVLLLFNTFPKKMYVNIPMIESEQVGIVVLTGGKKRIEKGVDLLLKGYGKKLFISGVFMPSEIELKFENEKEKNELFKCCVFFGEKAKNTVENAYEVEKWLNKNSEINSIILVSSYYHLPRSMMIFTKKIQPNIKIFPIPAVSKNNIIDQFFFHAKLVVSEYLKVIFTIFFVR